MKNVGRYDREIRFIAAAGLAVAGYLGEGWWRAGLWALALVPLFTALFRFCPLWSLLGINTYRAGRDR